MATLQEPAGITLASINKAPKKVFSFIGETLSMGDRLSELLYGVLMVTSISGLVLVAGPSAGTGLNYMLVVLFITIVLWGVLDGVSYALLSAANRAELESLVESIQAEGDIGVRRQAIEKELDETLVGRLDEGARSRIADIVSDGLSHPSERMARNRLSGYEKKIVLAAFMLDFTALVILVIPYLLVGELGMAALVSHSIALVMFIIIGYYYAKYAHLSKWKGAFACGLLGLILIIFAESTNLVLI